MKASMAALANTLRQINMSAKTAMMVLVGAMTFWVGFCLVVADSLPESAGVGGFIDRILFPTIGAWATMGIAWVNLKPKLSEWARS